MPNPATSIPLTDTLEFMQRLWALSHALERRSKQMAGAIGVTGPQRLVLRVVGLHPGMSAGDLAAILHVHPITLTRVLQRLATQKLLIRAADRAVRRRVVLRLTPRGVQVNTTS
jgi:DNA-binding MarR family transcriptional regulator